MNEFIVNFKFVGFRYKYFGVVKVCKMLYVLIQQLLNNLTNVIVYKL